MRVRARAESDRTREAGDAAETAASSRTIAFFAIYLDANRVFEALTTFCVGSRIAIQKDAS